MRSQLLAVALLAAAPACKGGSLTGTGGGTGTSISGAGGAGGSTASGTAGAGASVGSGGVTGSGGAGPSGGGPGGSAAGGIDGGAVARYPACEPDIRGNIDPRRMLLGDDGAPVGTSLTTPVTVTAIEGTQVTLADVAGGRRWTWSPDIPNLPPKQLNIGDRLDLTVDAHALPSSPAEVTCQTVVLAASGALVAFNSERQTPACSSLPALDAWGLSIVNAGPVCEHPSTDVRCDGFYFFGVQVSSGNESTAVAPGQTTSIKGVSLSLREFSGPTDYGCDGAVATASLAGFSLP
jgi:hypothetical protein